MTDWFDDESFWAAVDPFLFSKERRDAAKWEVEQLIQLTSVSAGAHVLDLGCGPGRHAIELASRGFQVTAVDRTQAYLTQASDAAKENGLQIEFIQSDMRTFHRVEAFDAAIILFSTFGFFEDKNDDLLVLKNVRQSLAAGGAVVIELLGKEILARTFQERTWHSNADATAFLLEERNLRSGWKEIDNRWILINDEGRKEYQWSIRVYSAAELESLLYQAGFTSVSIYGGMDKQPYNQNALRLVVVGWV